MPKGNITRAIGLLALSTTLATCKPKPNGNEGVLRLIGASPELQTVGPLRSGVDCLARRSKDKQILSQNCSVRVADTILFSVVNDEGTDTLLTGRHIHVSSAALRPLADSIEAGIERRYGTGVRCRIDSANDLYTERLVFWRVRARTLFLRTTTLEAPKALYPSIEFESDAGIRGCDGWLGERWHGG